MPGQIATTLRTHDTHGVRVVKISKFNVNPSIVVPLQTPITEYAAATGNIVHSDSKIEKIEENSDYILFKVTQYSQTVNEPIRVLWEGLREFDHGFQVKQQFDVLLRKRDEIAFIFAKKPSGDLFLSRLRKASTHFSIELIHFNFNRAQEIPGISNIWGVWEKVDLPNNSARANFGNQVDKSSVVHLSNATAIHIALENDGIVLTMTLSKEGQISSKQAVQKSLLIKLFDERFSNMVY